MRGAVNREVFSELEPGDILFWHNSYYYATIELCVSRRDKVVTFIVVNVPYGKYEVEKDDLTPKFVSRPLRKLCSEEIVFAFAKDVQDEGIVG